MSGLSLDEAKTLLTRSLQELSEVITRLQAIRDSPVATTLGLLANVRGSGYDIEPLRVAIDRLNAVHRAEFPALIAEIGNIRNQVNKTIG